MDFSEIGLFYLDRSLATRFIESWLDDAVGLAKERAIMKRSTLESEVHISNLLPKDLADRSRTESARRRNPGLHRSYIIPVLSKALVVMEILRSTERPLNVRELVDRTGISKTTVYRILRTLSAYGYLPNGSGGIYSLRHVSYPPKELMAAGTDPQDLRHEFAGSFLCD
jgi:hypothetical protein